MMLALKFLGLLWTIGPQFLSATTAAEHYQMNTMITAMHTGKAYTPLTVSYKMQELAVLPKYIKKDIMNFLISNFFCLNFGFRFQFSAANTCFTMLHHLPPLHVG